MLWRLVSRWISIRKQNSNAVCNIETRFPVFCSNPFSAQNQITGMGCSKNGFFQNSGNTKKSVGVCLFTKSMNGLEW